MHRLLMAAAGVAVVAATASPAHAGELTPRLQQLSDTPSLLRAPAAQRGAALSLAPTGGGSLALDDGRPVVRVRYGTDPTPYLSALRAAGAHVRLVDADMGAVIAAVAPADLAAVAGADGVRNVSDLQQPRTRGTSTAAGPATAARATCAPIKTEGDLLMRGPLARDTFKVDGTGQTVGIISDSYDVAGVTSDLDTDAADDVASGDLPGAANPCGRTTPVDVVKEAKPGNPNKPDPDSDPTDEGRGMAQIVHDVAPGARIAFSESGVTSEEFAARIRSLVAAGSTVLVDDIGVNDEPMFQDGPIAIAAAEAQAKGIPYYVAGGNDNGLGKDSYEASELRPVVCPAGLSDPQDDDDDEQSFYPDEGKCHSFVNNDPSYDFTIPKGSELSIDLQWAEPWNGVTTDLNVYLFDDATKKVIASSYDENTGSKGTQQSQETFSWKNETGSGKAVKLVIQRTSTSGTPRLKFINGANGDQSLRNPQAVATGDVVGPTVTGHAVSNAIENVGAVDVRDTSKVADISSRGPGRHVFAPWNGTTAAAPLAQEEVIAKPDLVAPDCGVTTFFGEEDGDDYRFCGTSAAAPHAAAVAALVRQRNPALAGLAVRQAVRVGANPVGAADVLTQGAGLVDAYDAVNGATPATNTDTGGGGGGVAGDTGTGGGGGGATSPPVSGGGGGAVIVKPKPVAPAKPKLGKKPKKVTRKRKATFTFNVPKGVTLKCKVDKKKAKTCGKRFSVKVKPGKHKIVVTATAGGATSKPLTYSWKVTKG